MTEYMEVVRHELDVSIDSDLPFTIDEVVVRIVENHRHVVMDQAEELVYRHLKTVVRNMMQRHAEPDEESQQTIPGLRLPKTLAIPAENESGFIWRSTNSATWDELQAARHVRLKNVERAQERLDQFDESVAVLRPIMEHDRSMTVYEAMNYLNAA